MSLGLGSGANGGAAGAAGRRRSGRQRTAAGPGRGPGRALCEARWPRGRWRGPPASALRGRSRGGRDGRHGGDAAGTWRGGARARRGRTTAGGSRPPRARGGGVGRGAVGAGSAAPRNGRRKMAAGVSPRPPRRRLCAAAGAACRPHADGRPGAGPAAAPAADEVCEAGRVWVDGLLGSTRLWADGRSRPPAGDSALTSQAGRPLPRVEGAASQESKMEAGPCAQGGPL